MKQRTLIFILALLSTLEASAYDINGIIYYLNANTMEATVTSNSPKYSGSVTIPEAVTYNNMTYSVTSIGEKAFNDCSGLTSVTIPNSVKEIGQQAFWCCSSLTSIEIPNSVTSIGSSAFSGCRSLTSVTMGNNVTEIGQEAFSECSSLTSVKFPNSVTSIGGNAFYGCSSLTSITIPNSVTSIGGGAFSGCSSLTSISVEDGNTVYDSRDNCNAIIETETNTLIAGCKNTKIPNNVMSIGLCAFYGCSGLTSVTIPNSVTEIEYLAFEGCSGLTSITIGNGVESIADDVFYGCSSLKDVYCYAESVPTTGNNAFRPSPQSTLHVPAASIKSYKAASPWKDFRSVVKVPEVIYNVDGNVYMKDIVMIGTPINPITEPKKEGHTFSGWSEIPETMPTYDVEVTGTFKYLLTYKVDNEVFKSDSIFYNSALTAIETPTKEGYTFTWSEIPKKMPAEDMVITGSFKINKYLLTYKVDDEIFKSDSIVYNSALTAIEAPTKEGYTFLGWSEIPATMPAEDVTITGTFSINKYLLTYKVDDEVFRSDSIVYNSTLTAIVEPTNEGYTFSGWSEIPETMPAHDVMVSGSFNINKYLLTYKIDNEVYKADSIAYNSALTAIAEPTNEGYTFSGWSEIPEKMPAEDVIITGSFKVNKYLLTYIVDNEVFQADSTVYNSALTAIDAPTKEGYTFSGWSAIPETMPANDVVVTGSFKINKYLLTYKVDDKVFKSDSIVYNSTIIVIEEPKKEGYTFSGWSKIPETMPAEDVVVTGSFSVNSYFLFYVLDGGVYKGLSIKYGTPIIPEVMEEKEGYTFSGWSEIPDSMPAHDVTIQGKYIIHSHTLTYEVDGEEYRTYTLDYHSRISLEAEPTKEGYTFSGWSEIPELMPDSNVVVTGSFCINSYTLTYKVDGEEYKTSTIVYGTELKVEVEPTKEGYTFSGWSEIPETMPAEDVVVTGSFTINKYKLTYMIDDKVYKDTVYEYSATIVPEPTPEGNYATFEWTGLPETMPAHDVVVHASYTTGIREIILAKPQDVQIYSPNGKKLNKLQKGLNIIMMKDGTIRKIVIK